MGTSLLRPFSDYARRPSGRGFARPVRRDGGISTRKEMLSIADAGGSRLGVNEKTMSARFVVTSDNPDRVGDVVEPAGISIEHFCTNPIAFFNHQSTAWPIGKWADYETDECTVQIEKHRAVAELFYSRRTPEGLQAFILTQEGILRATSIGFNPLEEPIPRRASKFNPSGSGFIFKAVDLLEISLVGVPCQPTATLVREHLSKGRIGGEPICEVFRKGLAGLAEPTPAWSNGANLMAKKKTPKAVSVDRLKGLLRLVPKEVRDELQECAAAKAAKVKSDHPDWDDEQVQALALSVCAEEKGLGEGGGTAGGYLVPPGTNGKPTGKKVATTKGPPPIAQQTPDQQQPPPQQQPMQQQPQQSMTPDARSGALEALLQVVEGVAAAYDQLTSGGQGNAPMAGADQDMGEPGMDEFDDGAGLNDFDEFSLDDDEEGDGDEDPDAETEAAGADSPDDDDDEEEMLDRYQRRGTRPKHSKRGRYYKADAMKRCKEGVGAAADYLDELGGLEDGKYGHAHRTASSTHGKALRSLLKDFDGEGDAAEDTAEMKSLAARLERRESLDLDKVMSRLGTLQKRVAAVGQDWQNLTGAMP